MNKIKISIVLAILTCFIATSVCSQVPMLDVLNYTVLIEPEIQEGSIGGKVVISFRAANRNSIVLNSGKLQIDTVTGQNVEGYKKEGEQLIIQLAESRGKESEITINYHGNPTKGLLFNTALDQAHTVYFTSHWMVCNDQPSDKATLSLSILVPKGKDCIASGELVEKEERENKTLFRWVQDYETPSYTYGFVMGDFNLVTDQVAGVKLNFYSSQLNAEKLKKVFEGTGSILQFFEQKSGVKYPQDSYSQVLIGRNYQEMSGLSVFSESYAFSVLKDSSEIHLTAHELAHQWWGNMITCQDFGHFWLNEAFAVYMATAFNEVKFGPEKYLADIALYKKIYDDLIERAQDKSLVFSQWEPSRDNRNLVYYKGAYVLHLLKQELGDLAFWKGIKQYSLKYYGKSVETADFKQAMEDSSNRNLDHFFDEWVYRKGK